MPAAISSNNPAVVPRAVPCPTSSHSLIGIIDAAAGRPHDGRGATVTRNAATRPGNSRGLRQISDHWSRELARGVTVTRHDQRPMKTLVWRDGNIGVGLVRLCCVHACKMSFDALFGASVCLTCNGDRDSHPLAAQLAATTCEAPSVKESHSMIRVK